MTGLARRARTRPSGSAFPKGAAARRTAGRSGPGAAEPAPAAGTVSGHRDEWRCGRRSAASRRLVSAAEEDGPVRRWVARRGQAAERAVLAELTWWPESTPNVPVLWHSII